MKLAVCPGSFDPVTVGHVDVIRRAAALFDEVLVLAAANSEKRPMFTLEERLHMLRLAVGQLPNVQVRPLQGLVAAAARQAGAAALVKGVRDAQDLAYEQMLAQVNARLAPGLETVLLPAAPQQAWISSTVAREMLRYHQDMTGLVPPAVQAYLADWIKKEDHP